MSAQQTLQDQRDEKEKKEKRNKNIHTAIYILLALITFVVFFMGLWYTSGLLADAGTAAISSGFDQLSNLNSGS